MLVDPNLLLLMLRQARTIAVVGLSPKSDRPSYRVAAYLQQVGYRIIPVHPTVKEVLGEVCYPSLDDIPREIVVDIVNVFRRGEDTPPIAAGAVRLGAKVFWLQSGIVSEDSMAIAHQGGLIPIQDACLMVEHRQVADQL